VRVAVVGNFDGVHRGHRELVRMAVSRAAESSPASVVAVTFDPHPTAIVRPERTPLALTSSTRRAALLREAGADEVITLAFTPELAAASPADFARLLRDPTGIAADLVMVGENFRFGKEAAGDTVVLADLGRQLGFSVEVMPLVVGDAAERPWSSTYVRDHVAEGDVQGAAEVLGRPHGIEGVVVRGDQRGRELGYPTANVDVPRGMAIPPDGVYAGWLVVDDEALPAAISVGTNPQFAGADRRIEAYVIDRDDLDLYGMSVRVDFVERLRDQAVFASVEELASQMADDVAVARRRLTG
jgi:riboflavin kinase / FMN adenylyltransferase